MTGRPYPPPFDPADPRYGVALCERHHVARWAPAEAVSA